MTRAIWTPAAKQCLENIFDFIAVENQSTRAAEKVVREIVAKSDIYADQSEMGTSREDLATDVRCFTVSNYVVLYRPASTSIEVLLVIHGARDIPVVFRGL